MEPELIAAIAAGGMSVLLLIGLLATRRSRNRARRRMSHIQATHEVTTVSLGTARAGEREAVWSLSETSRILDEVRSDRATALERLSVVEGDLDEARRQLSAADADLVAARKAADETVAEVARLETGGALTQVAPGASETGPEQSDERIEAISQALASEREQVARLTARLDLATGGDDASELRDRLVSSEAHRRDLEDRLTSLGAIRSAEQRSSAERIASLERLHLQIGHREHKIEELEADLKQAIEARDEALEEAARLEVEVVQARSELRAAQERLARLESQSSELIDARARIDELERQTAQSDGTASEVEQLRKSLEAERLRAERISRQASEAGTSASYAMWDRVVRERVDAAVARDTARLTDQVEHLRTVVAEKEARLRSLTSVTLPAAAKEPPPITAIKGIGPVIAGILIDNGVTSMADIAALTEADIDRLGDVMPVYPGRIRDDDWVGQAQSFL